MADTKVDAPGWLTKGQLSVLARLASEMPEGGTAAEVGAFCGQASLCILQAAPKGTTLVAIGAWDPPANVDDRTPLRDRNGKRAECSLDRYRDAVADYRVEAINTDRPILGLSQQKPEQLYDLVFLYEGYKEVPLEVQLDFWFSKLKPMGLLCGADFVQGFRDNVKTLLRYGTRKRVALGIEQNLWQMYNAV